MEKIDTKYNWVEIQAYYNAGHSCSEVVRKFHTSEITLYRAKARGLFYTRSRKDAMSVRLKAHGPSTPTQSDETKKKLSDIRIKFLTENPDKVPYVINHSSKKSWPEMVFENALISSGIIGWQSQYRCGIYKYDIAFPSQKIDVEIDGATHTSEKVRRIDARRDKWSIDNGWTVIRFKASRIKNDVIGCINDLKVLLYPTP